MQRSRQKFRPLNQSQSCKILQINRNNLMFVGGFLRGGGMTERQCKLDVIKLSSWLYISLCMTGLPVERCMAVPPPPLQDSAEKLPSFHYACFVNYSKIRVVKLSLTFGNPIFLESRITYHTICRPFCSGRTNAGVPCLPKIYSMRSGSVGSVSFGLLDPGSGSGSFHQQAKNEVSVV
jgi:hypothetical protein